MRAREGSIAPFLNSPRVVAFLDFDFGGLPLFATISFQFWSLLEHVVSEVDPVYQLSFCLASEPSSMQVHTVRHKAGSLLPSATRLRLQTGKSEPLLASDKPTARFSYDNVREQFGSSNCSIRLLPLTCRPGPMLNAEVACSGSAWFVIKPRRTPYPHLCLRVQRVVVDLLVRSFSPSSYIEP